MGLSFEEIAEIIQKSIDDGIALGLYELNDLYATKLKEKS